MAGERVLLLIQTLETVRCCCMPIREQSEGKRASSASFSCVTRSKIIKMSCISAGLTLSSPKEYKTLDLSLRLKKPQRQASNVENPQRYTHSHRTILCPSPSIRLALFDSVLSTASKKPVQDVPMALLQLSQPKPVGERKLHLLQTRKLSRVQLRG